MTSKSRIRSRLVVVQKLDVATNCTLTRRAFENARNPEPYAQRASSWTIREGLDSPLILGVAREIALADYKPNFVFTTLDDPLI